MSLKLVTDLRLFAFVLKVNKNPCSAPKKHTGLAEVVVVIEKQRFCAGHPC